jgi:hypothetical protein
MMRSTAFREDSHSGLKVGHLDLGDDFRVLDKVQGIGLDEVLTFIKVRGDYIEAKREDGSEVAVAIWTNVLKCELQPQ